jgi:hypothetical protein
VSHFAAVNSNVEGKETGKVLNEKNVQLDTANPLLQGGLRHPVKTTLNGLQNYLRNVV